MFWAKVMRYLVIFQCNGGGYKVRIIVFSDTHGRIDRCIEVLEAVADFDMILHAGDCVADAQKLAQQFPGTRVYFVRGNNDFGQNVSDVEIVHAEDKRLLLTHGHIQRVKRGLEDISAIRDRYQNPFDLIVFGHTHQSFDGYVCGQSWNHGILSV